ncbi:MAG: two pore domain potassium channel family protein [Oceanospirillaceae bacterium]|nr:two pore domain potassium channel family protein [Oceanospirillaceae bacterium]
MLINLMMGLPTMVFCLLLQSLLVMVVVNYYGNHRHQIENPSFISSLIVINVVMLLLVLGNLMQVAIWAVLFISLGEFDAFAEAFYHSAVNFATLGYGDFVMTEQHKLLGPLQAINGVLMIGVSTAALMSAFQDALKKTLQARQGG